MGEMSGTKETYRIWCVRGPGSIFGAAHGFMKDEGVLKEIDTREEAEEVAKRLNADTTSNVHYMVVRCVSGKESEVRVKT